MERTYRSYTLCYWLCQVSLYCQRYIEEDADGITAGCIDGDGCGGDDDYIFNIVCV